jgi:hypothetical protein
LIGYDPGMAHRWYGVFALLCGWGGAVIWAINLTTLQPGTELAKPWHDTAVGTDTYWARDLRWMAMVAVLVALLVAARGRPVRSAVAVLGAIAWLRLDLYLDRIDVAGRTATVRLAVGACAVITVAVVALGWRVRDVRGGSWILLLAAMVAAATAPIAGSQGSPTDTEPALNAAALAVGALLAAVAIGAALAAAPTMPAARMRIALGLAVVAGVALVGLRLLAPDDRLIPWIALAIILVTGVGVLRRDWPEERADWAWYVPMALFSAIGYPVLYIVTTLSSISLGDAATALAGNPPVNGADFDTLSSVAGVLTGLLFGAAYLIARRIRRATIDWRPYSFGPH